MSFCFSLDGHLDLKHKYNFISDQKEFILLESFIVFV